MIYRNFLRPSSHNGISKSIVLYSGAHSYFEAPITFQALKSPTQNEAEVFEIKAKHKLNKKLPEKTTDET